MSSPSRHRPRSVLVPDVVYFDNKLHTEVMAEMMKDFLLGENLLLIGSQGVGKNKIVDRCVVVSLSSKLSTLRNQSPRYIGVSLLTLGQFECEDLDQCLCPLDGRMITNDCVIPACRFLHLLNRPREYIQLHRDTTVQSLTLQPTVKSGVIVYEAWSSR